VAVADKHLLPKSITLLQNYPNPFNPVTEIRYRIAEYSFVSLKVYNLLGQEVAELVNDYKQPGTHSVTFDASRLASGTYFYRLVAGNHHDVKKFTVLK
jgi:hypothetical protein